MDKIYYIIPTTKSYYEEVIVGENQNDHAALEKFLDNTEDTGFAEYFDAVAEKPFILHEYDVAVNGFEQIINYVVYGNVEIKACFYMEQLHNLQVMYDNLISDEKTDKKVINGFLHVANTCRKSMLFELPLIKTINGREKFEKILNQENVGFQYSQKNRVFVDKSDVKKTIAILEKYKYSYKTI